MPDITMCHGQSCPRAETCYRHTAPECSLQSYFCTPPIDELGECEYYWESRSTSKDKEAK